MTRSGPFASSSFFRLVLPRVLLTLAMAAVFVSVLLTQPERHGIYMDQSTFLLQALSVGRDGDNRYGPEDRERFLQLGWGTEPLGLFLRQSGENYYFAKPAGYALLAAPLSRFFPNRGPLVLNAVLWCLLLELSFRWLRRSMHPLGAALFALLCWGATAVPFYLFVIHPDILIMTLLAVVLYFGLAGKTEAPRLSWLAPQKAPRSNSPEIAPRRLGPWQPLVLGMVAGLMVYEKLPLVFFVGSIALLWWTRGWWRQAVLFAACSAVSFFAFSSIHLLEDGQLTSYQGKRLLVVNAGPFSSRAKDPGAIIPVNTKQFFQARAVGGRFAPARLRAIAEKLPRTVLYLLAGRKGGLFPYLTPLLLLLLLALWNLRRAEGRRALWVLFPLAAYCAFYLVLTPLTFHGGQTSVGNRYGAQVAPAMLFAVAGVPVAGSLVAAGAVLALMSSLLFPGRALLNPATGMRDNFLLFQWRRLAWLPLETEMLHALCDRHDCQIQVGKKTMIYRLSEPGPPDAPTSLWFGSAADSRFLLVRSGERGSTISLRLATASDAVKGYVESGSYRTPFSLGDRQTLSFAPRLPEPVENRLSKEVQYSWPLRVVVTDVKKGNAAGGAGPGEGLFVQLAQPVDGYPERRSDGSFVIDPGDRRAASLLLWGWWGLPAGVDRGERWAGEVAETALALPLQQARGARLESVVGGSFGGAVTVSAMTGDGSSSATFVLQPPPARFPVGLQIPPAEGNGDVLLRLNHSDLRRPSDVTGNPKVDNRPLSALYKELEFKMNPAPGESREPRGDQGE